MKQFTVYTFKGKMFFDEECVRNNTYRQLKDPEQSEELSLTSFIPLYDETLLQQVGNYQIVKIHHTERKEPDKGVLLENVDEYLEDHPNTDVLAAEEIVRRHLMKYTGLKQKESLVVIDNTTGKLIVAQDRNFGDVIIDKIRDVLSYKSDYEDLELLSTCPVITEKVLTRFVVKEECVPEPLALGEVINLGKPNEVDKRPKPANVKISKTYAAEGEVIEHTRNGKYVKLLELEWDGVIDFQVDTTLFIKGVKFKESMKVEKDDDVTDSVHFMTQMQVQLPEIIKIIDKLLNEVKSTTL